MEKRNSRERGRLTGVTTVVEPPYYPPCAAAASLIHLLHREKDERERLKTHPVRSSNTDNPKKLPNVIANFAFTAGASENKPTR